MILLEHMIRSGRLWEFVNELVNIRNNEMEDRTMWEFWLHKVFDMTYADFVARAKNNGKQPEKTMAQEEIEATVMESQKILSGFCLS